MNNLPLSINQVPDPERLERIPIRPLGKISDFVAMDLPVFIREIQAGNATVADLSRIADELSTGIEMEQCNTSLAHLDLFMLKTAIKTLRGTVGEKLNSLCEYSAARLETISGLSYEDVIYANPLQKDPRVFTGRSEVFFYGAHRKIEAVCAEVICQMEALFSSGGSTLADAANEALQPRLLFIQKQMEQISMDLPKDDFKNMRDFFMTDKSNNLKGPSGNFSAGIFSIDSFIYGDNPEMQKFQAGKMNDMQYFPLTTAEKNGFPGRLDMIKSHSRGLRGVSVHSRLMDMDNDARQVLRTIFEVMDKMRCVHFSLAQKYIVRPLVEEGKMDEREIPGSAKTLLVEYLMRAKNIYQNALSTFS